MEETKYGTPIPYGYSSHSSQSNGNRPILISVWLETPT